MPIKTHKYPRSQTNRNQQRNAVWHSVGAAIYTIILTHLILGSGAASAQQEIAQQAYAIFQQSCLGCHGPHGAYTEQLIIEAAPDLIATGVVVPGNPNASEFYKRLLGPTANGAQMPLNQPPLSQQAIATIRQWIQVGAPSWEIQHDVTFITTDAMLTTIGNHLKKLDAFDRPFARYFTTTHLYNAGERPEALRAYHIALSKLVNSLSWGFQIINPQPIDATETIFHIDLRNYEWDRRDAWTQMEAIYPYTIAFDEETRAGLHGKLSDLRQEMACEVPFVHVDWFLATASLPPLYHDILALPETERELERELGIDVARNLQSAPGVRVWRAGTNNSGVSNHNRVVERHRSRYGAYWKSHDFAGSVGTQNIFTHPLSFERDGGEVIFHLPNGLQAYYISDGLGNRIDVAPTDIVSNPAARDPAVRNGLSCIGCHTEGMKEFEDGVRAVIQQTANPSYDKAHALRLYVDQAKMDSFLAEDRRHYREALEETGGVFGGIEPVSRFYEAFQEALDISQAAAAVGLESEALLGQIRANSSLQSLGLTGLLSGGNVKRDVWTSNFEAVVSCLYGNDCPTRDDNNGKPIFDLIPDANLRAAIAERLGKAPAAITEEDLARLTELTADESGIRNLSGLEHAIRLERIEFRHNSISDLSPLAELVRLNNIKLRGNRITDVSPLASLTNVDWLGLEENKIKDLSPLKRLIKLNGIGLEGNPIGDVSPLAGCISLEGINARRTAISDFSPLAKLPRFRWLEIDRSNVSNLSGLVKLTQLTRLQLSHNSISDVSPLAKLTRLKSLELNDNIISDVSPLAELTHLEHLQLSNNIISDVSPLAGLTNLKHLSLDSNAISDFSPLKALFDKIYIQVGNNPGFFSQGGPKITGPWLWVLLPGAQFEDFRDRDLLAGASGRKVTEREIATNGAVEGESVGDSIWTSHKISPTGGNNINDILTALGISKDDGQNLVYGSVTVNSPREQKTRMFAGSDNSHKVWINGQLVSEKHWDWSVDYQQFFPVMLRQGKNVLLVAVHDGGGGWCGHFGFAPDAEYTVLDPGTRFNLSANATQIQQDDTFTLRLTAANITDLAGWQTDIAFDPALLKANWVSEGNFLKQGGGQTFFQQGTIKNKQGKITGIKAARISKGGVEGEGTLLSVRFTAITRGEGRVVLRNFRAGSSTGQTILSTPPDTLIVVKRSAPTFPAWDVNKDGITNASDVALVTDALGQKPPKNPRTDVNGDGVVNGKDLALVAEHLGERAAPAAPLVGGVYNPDTSREMVEHALNILHAADDGSLTFQRGIANLESLLALFVPDNTVLLPNYPNPFNPETWIPYQLAEAADVTLHIYTANGVLVRTLHLGHQPAGIYQYRSRAAYWDGRNEVGEPVASGVYFYTIFIGNFTATRKMLIIK